MDNKSKANKRIHSEGKSSDEDTPIKRPSIEKKSPHTLQTHKDSCYIEKDFTDESRLITDMSPREKYQRRSDQDKTTFHFGQRKLMLSEIEFLTNVSKEFSDTSKKVCLIYAGAAPGIHISMLMNMFPFMEYILVDPAKFELDEKKPLPKFKLINECFTDEMAKEFKKKYADYEILFISDIRTANHRILTKEDTEFKIEQDMMDQMKWYDILKPFKSMFKFRLPYVGDDKVSKTKLEYLDGKLYLQIWEGKTSSETRLVVDRNAKKKLYDCVQYEDQLYRFNTVERVNCYKHDIEAPGIDHCYDCRAEVFILDQYLKTKDLIKAICMRNNDQFSFKENETVRDLILSINTELNASRKTEGLKYTINGKRNLYSVSFTDIYYGANLNDLFHPDKIVHRQNFTYNIEDKEDEETKRKQLEELLKSNTISAHTLQNKKAECVTDEFDMNNSRLLTDSFREKIRPKEKYQFNDSTTVYFRERMLRLGEIEFLTLVCSELAHLDEFKYEKVVLIYAGASPSSRLELLHEMFPFIKFLLYDPSKIDARTSPMVEIKQEYFTESIALELKETYADYIRLFISNIKRAKNFTNFENIQLEKEDMQLQMSYHYNLEPFKSLLRFRIPYPETRADSKPEIDYFDGKIFFKLWSLNNVIDTNLMVDKDAPLKKYAFLKYRNQLHRFNTVERVQCYKHDVDVDGFDHCYDCRGEVYVFDLYLKYFNTIFDFFFKPTIHGSKPLKKSTKEFIQELNGYLKADEKTVKIEFNKEKYFLKFTDIKYGKTFNEMFKKNMNVSESMRSTLKQPSDLLYNRLDFQTKFDNRATYYNNGNNYRNNKNKLF